MKQQFEIQISKSDPLNDDEEAYTVRDGDNFKEQLMSCCYVYGYFGLFSDFNHVEF